MSALDEWAAPTRPVLHHGSSAATSSSDEAVTLVREDANTPVSTVPDSDEGDGAVRPSSPPSDTHRALVHDPQSLSSVPTHLETLDSAHDESSHGSGTKAASHMLTSRDTTAGHSHQNGDAPSLTAPWRRPFGAPVARSSQPPASTARTVNTAEEDEEDEQGPRPSRSAPQPISFVETSSVASESARPWERYLATHRRPPPTAGLAKGGAVLANESTFTINDGSGFDVSVATSSHRTSRRPSHQAPLASPNAQSERTGNAGTTVGLGTSADDTPLPYRVRALTSSADKHVNSWRPLDTSRISSGGVDGWHAAHAPPANAQAGRFTPSLVYGKERRTLSRPHHAATEDGPSTGVRAASSPHSPSPYKSRTEAIDGAVSSFLSARSPLRLWERAAPPLADSAWQDAPRPREELPLPTPHRLPPVVPAERGRAGLDQRRLDDAEAEDDSSLGTSRNDREDESVEQTGEKAARPVTVPPPVFMLGGDAEAHGGCPTAAEPAGDGDGVREHTRDARVDWLGLQRQLRLRTHSTHIFRLDFSSLSNLSNDQWCWFSQDVLPQLRALEVLCLRNMNLNDAKLTALTRGCRIDGLHTHHVDKSAPGGAADLSANDAPAGTTAALPAAYYYRRASTGRPTTAAPHAAATSQPEPEADASTSSPPVSPPAGVHLDTSTSPGDEPFVAPRDTLPRLRVLDLSGNRLTHRSATTVGRVLLWAADTLDELRLAQNPLGDNGFHTLSIYLAACKAESLRPSPPRGSRGAGAAARTWTARLPRGLKQAYAMLSAQREDETLSDAQWQRSVAALHIGPSVLDVRACGASLRGVSTLLAGASEAHQLTTLAVSFNAPLTVDPSFRAVVQQAHATQQQQLRLASSSTPTASPGAPAASRAKARCHKQPSPEMALWGHTSATTSETEVNFSTRYTAAVSTAERTFLAPSPIVTSGVLMTYPPFSSFAELRAPCALRRLGLCALPLSQVCAPVGVRELLLNLFVCSDQLTLLDLSNTFEADLVPESAAQALLRDTARRQSWGSALAGPEQLMGWQRFLETEGEVEFTMPNIATAGQTRVGDVTMELLAHASFNALVRASPLPPAFRTLRELHLGGSGLTDEAIHGLRVAVKSTDQTGMLASLTVLDVSRNWLSVAGCDALLQAMIRQWPLPRSRLQAVALEQNRGMDAGDRHVWERLRHTAEACLARRLHEALAERNAATTTEAEPSSSDAVAADVPPLRIQCGPVNGPLYEWTCDRRGRAYTTFPESVAAGASATTAWTAEEHDDDKDDDDDTPRRPRQQDSAPPHSAARSGVPDVSSIHGSVIAPQDEVSGRGRRVQSWHEAPVPARNAGTTPSLSDSAYTVLGPLLAATRAEPRPMNGTDGRTDRRGASPTRPRLLARLEHRPQASRNGSPSAERDAVAGTQTTPPVKPEEEWWLTTPRGGGRLVSPSPDSGDERRAVAEPGVSGRSEEAVGAAMPSPSEPQRGASLDCSPLPADTGVPPPPHSGGDDATGVEGPTAETEVAHASPAEANPQDSPSVVLLSDRLQPAATLEQQTTVPTTADGIPTELASGETAERPVPSLDEPSTTAEVDKLSQRGKHRPVRTFALTYVHPEGHLLCRAMHVLQQPADVDPIGEEARAAMEKDLLAALQPPVLTETTSSGQQKLVTESLRCVSLCDPAQALGAIRFEVTTNEKRADMAVRLQHCLNGSLEAQRDRFPRLTTCLDRWEARRVRRSGMSGGTAAATPCTDDGQQANTIAPAADRRLCGWDTVNVVEALAHCSAYARHVLDTRYDSRASAAVHQHHPLADMHNLLEMLGAKTEATGDASSSSSESYYTPPSTDSASSGEGDVPHTPVRLATEKESTGAHDETSTNGADDEASETHPSRANPSPTRARPEALVISATAPDEGMLEEAEVVLEEAGGAPAVLNEAEVFTVSTPLQLGSASEEMAALRRQPHPLGVDGAQTRHGSRSDSTSAADDEDVLALRVQAATEDVSVPAHLARAGTADGEDDSTQGAAQDSSSPHASGLLASGRRERSELTGRVKSFLLSFSHLEGTIVCRAWFLLHQASPIGAIAREAMEEDLLSLLQPDDEADRAHGVLSVTIQLPPGAANHSGTDGEAARDSQLASDGAISNLLSLRVETNERRGDVSARLLSISRPSVVRGSPLRPVGRDNVVSPAYLSQKNLFPRLAAVLEAHPETDSLRVVEDYLAATPMRLTLRSAITERYRSLATFVHYHHGTMADLANELGAPSWTALQQRVGGTSATDAPAGAHDDISEGETAEEEENADLAIDSTSASTAQEESCAQAPPDLKHTAVPPARLDTKSAVPPRTTTSPMTERERLFDNRVRRLLRVSYEGLASGAVALDESQRQRRVVCRGKWTQQRLILTVEWGLLLVVYFEKKSTFGSRKSAPMLIHPLMQGLDYFSAAREGGDATELIVRVTRPCGPEELGVSATALAQRLDANVQLTVSSKAQRQWQEARQRRLVKQDRRSSRDSAGARATPTRGDTFMRSDGSDHSAPSPGAALAIVDVLQQPQVEMRVSLGEAKKVQESAEMLQAAARRATEAVEASIRSA